MLLHDKYIIMLKNNKLLIYRVCVCDQFVTKYLNAEFKEGIYFVNEVETQLREKSLRDSQT
jgi:tricorn protease-like protein